MRQEVDTLISLLEDNDREVIHAVSDEILRQGVEILPELERAWENVQNEKIQERLVDLIHHIQFENTKDKLKEWVRAGAGNILEGAVYVSQFQYPDSNLKLIEEQVNRIAAEVNFSSIGTLSAMEKVRLLNYVYYDLNNFSRNSTNFYSPQNSFINQVVELRKGNPISLGIVYMAIAQKLGMPVYGVNLPKTFILAYMSEYRHYQADDPANDVLFYINPYNKGTIINRREIDYFIEQQKLKAENSYYVPCDNKNVILRLVTNLIIAYQKLGYKDKIRMLNQIVTELC